MDKQLAEILTTLRLLNLRDEWDQYVALTQKKRLSAVKWLRQILEDEHRARQVKALARRLKRAKIPVHWVMETYPFDQQPKLNKKKILSLYDTYDVEKNENLIWVGPTGCGKTGLATSFLIQAIQQGFTGRYISFPDLVCELYQSVADHSEDKVIKRYLSFDCLLIDEVGYVEVEPIQVGLFFTLMQKRHGKRPTFVTSNLGFSEWRSFLKNDHLTAALIDRLTEDSHVINMKNGKSLRRKPRDL